MWVPSIGGPHQPLCDANRDFVFSTQCIHSVLLRSCPFCAGEVQALSRRILKMNAEIRTPWKSRFTRTGQAVYLDTAAEGLPLDDSRNALLEYFEDK